MGRGARVSKTLLQPLLRSPERSEPRLQSQTPIFDRLVADFAACNKNYIEMIGGIKPQPHIPDLDGLNYVKPGAEPLGWNVNDTTQTMDAITDIRPNIHHKVISVLAGEPDTESETESLPSPDD